MKCPGSGFKKGHPCFHHRKNYLRTNPVERFWSKVDFPSVSSCWNWKGAIQPTGYGAFSLSTDLNRSITVTAHRFAWEDIMGPIPVSLYVLHRCDNPLCVNPHHLFLGTNSDNLHDMWQKGRA